MQAATISLQGVPATRCVAFDFASSPGRPPYVSSRPRRTPASLRAGHTHHTPRQYRRSHRQIALYAMSVPGTA
eukprot:3076053-Rhodomonas_salina.1